MVRYQRSNPHLLLFEMRNCTKRQKKNPVLSSGRIIFSDSGVPIKEALQNNPFCHYLTSPRCTTLVHVQICSRTKNNIAILNEHFKWDTLYTIVQKITSESYIFGIWLS